MGTLVDTAKANWIYISGQLPKDIPIWKLEKILSNQSSKRGNFTEYLSDYPKGKPENVVETGIKFYFKPGPDDTLINLGEKRVKGTYFLFEGKSKDDVLKLINDELLKPMVAADVPRALRFLASVQNVSRSWMARELSSLLDNSQRLSHR